MITSYVCGANRWFRAHLGVILIKVLSVCRAFISNASIGNTFKENHLAFGYKLKRFSDGVFGNILDNKK